MSIPKFIVDYFEGVLKTSSNWPEIPKDIFKPKLIQQVKAWIEEANAKILKIPELELKLKTVDAENAQFKDTLEKMAKNSPDESAKELINAKEQLSAMKQHVLDRRQEVNEVWKEMAMREQEMERRVQEVTKQMERMKQEMERRSLQEKIRADTKERLMIALENKKFNM